MLLPLLWKVVINKA